MGAELGIAIALPFLVADGLFPVNDDFAAGIRAREETLVPCLALHLGLAAEDGLVQLILMEGALHQLLPFRHEDVGVGGAVAVQHVALDALDGGTLERGKHLARAE